QPILLRRPHRALRATPFPYTTLFRSQIDVATPLAGAQEVASQLPGSVLLTYDGIGHGAYGPMSKCTENAVDAYLLTGQTPPRGTDRKSTRLNSSHVASSYAVLCLKKK